MTPFGEGAEEAKKGLLGHEHYMETSSGHLGTILSTIQTWSKGSFWGHFGVKIRVLKRGYFTPNDA